MRQPTAEVRLNEHKQRVSAQRGQHLAVLAVNEVGCDRISLPRNPLGTEDRDQQLRYPGNVGYDVTVLISVGRGSGCVLPLHGTAVPRSGGAAGRNLLIPPQLVARP